MIGYLTLALIGAGLINKVSRKTEQKNTAQTQQSLNPNATNPYERSPKQDCIEISTPKVLQPKTKSPFVPAKTLNEAREWGVRNLGVEGYYSNFTDLEIMNYVNEALYEMKTKFAEKAVMPKNIDGRIKTEHSPDSIMCVARYADGSGVYMGVNCDYLHNIDKPIKELIDDFVDIEVLNKDETDGKLKLSSGFSSESSKEVETLINKYNKNPNSLTIKEKITLHRTLESVSNVIKHVLKYPTKHIVNMMKKYDIKSFTVDDKKYTAENLHELDTYWQGSVAAKFLKTPKVQGYFDIEIVDGKQLVFHEFGHILHKNAIGQELYDKMDKLEKLEQHGLDKTITLDFINDTYKQEIASKVSNYAKESPLEFVAEVFSRIMLGKEMPDDVMRLYKEYGGPQTCN